MMINPWTLINTKNIYADPFLKLNANAYKTDKGDILESCTVLTFPQWVNVIAITDDDKIVLVRQYRHAADIINIGIPAGSVESIDKTAQEAVSRELMEETGYEADKLVYLNTTYPNPARQDNTVVSFLAYGLVKKSEIQERPNETLEIIHEDFIDFAKRTHEESGAQSLFVASLSFAIHHILRSDGERFKSLKHRVLTELYCLPENEETAQPVTK